MTSTISIIIPHWNTPELLEKLLVIIGKNPKQNNLEIIVVDNNSKNPPIDFVEKYSQVKFVFNKSNYGFAMACNMGATQARGEWLLFLNPDLIITNSQIQKLLDYAVNNKLDALSPIPENFDYHQNNYAKPIPSLANLLIEFSPLRKIINLESSKKTLTGGCLLIKNTVLQKMGGWDERFFLWFEDSDLSKRLYDKGYHLGWYPESVAHSGGKSIKKLSAQRQKDIFFHSLNSYSAKHFKNFEKNLLAFNNKRYSKRKTLPILEDGISIVIPNAKLEILKSFLIDNWPILKKQAESGIIDLIVVSSALNHKNIWQFRAEFPQIRFILLEKNKGFAHTVNQGWKASIKKWLATINDDTIIDRSWIDESIKYLSDQVGSMNPLILDMQGKIESAGINILPIGKAQPLTIKPEMPFYQTQATNGAVVIYNHRALETTGLFDERFGSYLEDLDLSLRLSRKKFYNTVITTTHVVHKKHATSRNMGKYKKWLDFKNWWLLILKNWPIKWWLKYFPQIILERGRNFWGIFK